MTANLRTWAPFQKGEMSKEDIFRWAAVLRTVTYCNLKLKLYWSIKATVLFSKSKWNPSERQLNNWCILTSSRFNGYKRVSSEAARHADTDNKGVEMHWKQCVWNEYRLRVRYRRWNISRLVQYTDVCIRYLLLLRTPIQPVQSPVAMLRFVYSLSVISRGAIAGGAFT